MPKIDDTAVKKLEEKYDPEMQVRPLVPPATWLVGSLLFMTVFIYLLVFRGRKTPQASANVTTDNNHTEQTD